MGEMTKDRNRRRACRARRIEGASHAVRGRLHRIPEGLGQNIDEHGIIVSHPRTANPIENPFLAIRDRAAKKLDGMRKVKADFLW